MRIVAEQNVVTKVCTEIICDRCRTRILADNDAEWHKAHWIEFTAGYDSVFGDGNKVECDLCQKCLKDLIGSFARIIEPYEPQSI